MALMSQIFAYEIWLILLAINFHFKLGMILLQEEILRLLLGTMLIFYWVFHFVLFGCARFPHNMCLAQLRKVSQTWKLLCASSLQTSTLLNEYYKFIRSREIDVRYPLLVFCKCIPLDGIIGLLWYLCPESQKDQLGKQMEVVLFLRLLGLPVSWLSECTLMVECCSDQE